MNPWNTFDIVNAEFGQIKYKNLSGFDPLSQEKCYNCTAFSVILDDGHKVCTRCGYNNGNILDMQVCSNGLKPHVLC